MTPDGPDPFDKNAADAITAAQRDVLVAWLRDAGDRLALRDWRIRVSTCEAGPERVTRMAEKLLEHELGNRTEAVIEAAIQEVEEQSVDRLAYAVSEFMPEVPEA